MDAKRLQGWWLAACVAALLLANWAGGFSLVVTAVFVVIYLTGATLIGRDEDSDSADDAEEDNEEDTESETEASHTPESSDRSDAG